MTWYAVDTLDDALEESDALLRPVSLAVWLRLAVVSLFAGGVAGTRNPSLSLNLATASGIRGALEYAPRLVLLGLAALVLFVVLAFVGSVMEFVLVDALRSRTVRLRAPFRAFLGRGLRLLAFQVALGLVVLLPLALLAAVLLAAFASTSLVLVAAAVLIVPVVLLVAVAAVAVNAATVAFVVPLMADRDCGVLDGWRAFWPTLRGELPQFLVYAVVRVALGVLVGVLTGVVAGAFAVPAAFASGLLSRGGGLAVIAFGTAVVLTFLGALAVLVAVRVPVVTYLRYHSLLVLDRSDADFALR